MSGTFTPTPGHQHFLAGFDNSADCSLSFGGTRTVTITPVGSTFRVWANGQKFDKPTTTKQISTDQGLHFVYFDTSGVIQESHTTPWSITGLGAPICTVYWDGTNGALCDERHSAYRDRYWHKWAHDTVGTRWLSGFVPTINANCTFSLSTGVVADEDLQFNTGGAKTACTQWHRNATGWLLESNKTVLYHGTSSAPEYDASGTMTAVDNNKYFNSYIYATGDVSYPIYCVIGQAQHNTLAGATGEAIPSFTSAQFSAEMKLLYRVTMQFSGGAATYVQYQDYRTSSTLPAGQATATQAAQVSFSPAGTVAATNVQAAIEELDTEKSATGHTHDGLLTAAQATDLTDGGETTLHSHAAGGGNPTGTLIIWPTDTAPSGYLLCYGQAVSRTTYSALYAVIGTVFGVGDNSTTFNVPDLRGRVPLGQDDMGGSSANRATDAAADSIGGVDGHETHALSTAELASHAHDQQFAADGLNLTNFACNAGGSKSASGYAPNGIVYYGSKYQVETKTTGSGTAHNNMQPYITLNYCIKT